MTADPPGGPDRDATAPPGTLGTSTLLQALLSDPLDPGYAAAARRRAATAAAAERLESERSESERLETHGGAGPPLRDRLLTASGALLVGLLLVVAYLHAHRSAPADARTRADLRARITAARAQADELSRTVSSLQAAADARRVSVLGASSDDLSSSEMQAGTTAVHGPGIQVTIDNPPVARSSAPAGRPGTTPIGAVSVLSDLDVREVVNELWAEGAEAVAVDDIRLTPTSAIRFAGQAVLVDFQPISAPYVITAVGDPDTMITQFTASAVADRLRTLSSADGFTFGTDQRTDVALPASAIGVLRYAHVRSTPSAGPTS